MAAGFFRKILRRSLIIANVAAALLWLGACYAGGADPGTFWWIGLLPLAALFLLGILVVFFFAWLLVKPTRALISLTTVLLGWVPMQNILQIRRPVPFSYKETDSTLRVMTWNVRHFDIAEHRKRPGIRDSMIDLVLSGDPDVACFQEMVGSDSFPKAINYIPYFSKKLKMKYRTYSYNARLNYDKQHHFGIITFSKYPIINRKTLSFPPYNYNSIFQYSDIVKKGDTFRVFNIHLQTQKFSKQNREYVENPTLKGEPIENSQSLIAKLRRALKYRKEQSDHVREEIAKSPYPVILCGDFNDVPNSYAYCRIGEGLQDAFTVRGSGIDRTYIGISPTLRIDYVFCDPAFRVIQYDRIKKEFSDHYPVVADLFLETHSRK